MDVIGFAGAGCSVAKIFEKYSQYSVHYIDVDLHGDSKYSLLKSKTMEEAEQNTPVFLKLIKKLKNEVIFICAGSGVTSGSILAVLEQIKHLQITLIYIRPDIDLLNTKAKQREKVVHGILQHFARSGMLKQLCLIDNNKVVEVLGNLSIVEYYTKINEMIANSFHMLNYFKNVDSIMSNISAPREINRISTIGIYNIEEAREKYFYDIESIREKCFYFAFNKHSLNEEKNLLNKISKQMKKAGQSEFTDVSYNITATTYEENFAYIEAYTNFIQGEKIVDKSSE